MAACLRRSFRELSPTHELRLTVLGIISDRELSLAISRFLRRLRYWLSCLGLGFEYFTVQEWSDGHRHTHILVRTEADLTPEVVGTLWQKTLPSMQVTKHCDRVRNPVGMANYVVKHLKDSSKKELPPEGFQGRIYAYSRHFFTKQVAALWKEQCQEWYPPRSRPD
jgi:hypothetical protein